ncbi:MAG: DUF3467 domain-containing protein [Candidatus Woesearchaeota archaeon]
MEQKINLNINDGDAFYAHQASINFNPTMFFLDFKSISPRIDERSRENPTFALKHNLVMIDPYHATMIRDMLVKALKDYEKKFGKIEIPKAIKKIEKEKKTTMKEEVPNYFG